MCEDGRYWWVFGSLWVCLGLAVVGFDTCRLRHVRRRQDVLGKGKGEKRGGVFGRVALMALAGWIGVGDGI